MPEVTLPEQIACVRREITMRERTYPKWVAGRRMVQSKADTELRAMRKVLVSLEWLEENTMALDEKSEVMLAIQELEDELLIARIEDCRASKWAADHGMAAALVLAACLLEARRRNLRVPRQGML